MKNIIKIYLLIICGIFLSSSVAQAAGHLIKGKVSNVYGLLLPGVTVTSDGIASSVLTNEDGEFKISVNDLPTTLYFYLPNYGAVEQNITSDQDLVVVLPVNETANVAYGKQSKKSVTSSVATISGEELVASRSNNLFIALQGKLPGLSIIQSDGEPGNESFNVKVRGSDSPNSNSVMYVVDGVERSADGVDLNEVESVTVLKDGAATAPYGMRGSGGVILITTKSGFEGESKINVSVDHALQAPTFLPDFVSAYDYATMYNQRVTNDRRFLGDEGYGELYTPYELERYQNADMTEFYPVRNMQDDFLKDFTNQTRVNVNVRGGSSSMRYFTSVGYTTQEGIFENEPFDLYSYDASTKSSRFNFRTNLDISLNKTLNLWVNIGGYMEKNNSPIAGDLFQKLYQTPNNAYNDLTPDGEVLVNLQKLTYQTKTSIYGDLNRTGSSNKTETRLNNTFGATQKLDKFVPGLSAKGQLAFDVNSRNTQNRSRGYESFQVATFQDVNGVDSLGYAEVPGTSNTTLSDGQGIFFYYMYNFRASLDYNRTFGEKHHLTGMLMAERHMQQQQVLLETNYMGLAGRVAYGFDDRYFAEANFAYQGSEQFKKGNRFGFFPSISASWLVSNEDFLKESDAVTMLKVRASAGQTGNSVFSYGSTNQYLFLTTWNSNSTEDQLGNENIKWETSTKYNFGIEAQLFNSLYVGADLYYHDNKDIIIRDIAIIPDGMMGLGGASLPPANLGESINKGFELTLGYSKEFNEDFAINVNGNVSVNKNEITYLAELAYDETYAYPYRREGYPVSYHWGYQSDGLFNTQQEIDDWHDQSGFGGTPVPGDIKYKDLTGDGIVDEKDIAPLGVGQVPELHFGLNAQVYYKGFDLKAFFTGAAQRNVYQSGIGIFSNQDNFTEYMKGAWTFEKYSAGETIEYPRLGRESGNFVTSDYWLKNGTFVRLRNVELGYTLPASISNKIKSGAIRIYANGLNLFVWDSLDNDDFDPESADAATTNYPILKALNLGVSVQF